MGALKTSGYRKPLTWDCDIHVCPRYDMKVIVRVETLTDCGESESVEPCCVERPTSELDPRFGAGGIGNPVRPVQYP
jgi:hypothetical protein